MHDATQRVGASHALDHQCRILRVKGIIEASRGLARCRQRPCHKTRGSTAHPQHSADVAPAG